MTKLHKVFQTLSDSNRLLLLQSIGESERSVGELVQLTSLSQPLVSHHLRVLKENGILITKRRGPFIYYSFKDLNILAAIKQFMEIFPEKESDSINKHP